MSALLAILSAILTFTGRNLKTIVTFLAGAAVGTAIVSLYQDLVFKTADRYAEYILNGGWTDRSITIPLVLIIIASAISVVVFVHRG